MWLPLPRCWPTRALQPDELPAPEVARRAGHGVAVLLRIYANCIDGQAAAANQRINEALNDDDSE